MRECKGLRGLLVGLPPTCLMWWLIGYSINSNFICITADIAFGVSILALLFIYYYLAPAKKDKSYT